MSVEEYIDCWLKEVLGHIKLQQSSYVGCFRYFVCVVVFVVVSVFVFVFIFSHGLDKDKDTEKVPETSNIYYIFEILMTQAFQK